VAGLVCRTIMLASGFPCGWRDDMRVKLRCSWVTSMWLMARSVRWREVGSVAGAVTRAVERFLALSMGCCREVKDVSSCTWAECDRSSVTGHGHC
jgi:hypothetical protein